MARSEESSDSKQSVSKQDGDDETTTDGVENLKLDSTIVATVATTKSIAPPLNALHQQQSCALQQTTVYHRNQHSRNPSSINGITIATQFIQPPPNKPDAINSLLKLIRFRSDYNDCDEKSQNRQICGIREARLIMMFILIVVIFISGTIFFVMWFTEFYNDSIVSSLVLAQNSTASKYFIKPPLNPQLRVHIFNYTNTERFLKGLDDKLIVNDVGPYIYTEMAEKVDVVYNDNNTISYRESRRFEFRPEISAGHQYDPFVVPNVPFLTAAWQLKKASFLQDIAVKSVLIATNSRPFVHVPAHSFLWGYDDALIDQSKWSSNPPKFDKFGMLTTRNGTSAESFTINSGVDDIRKLNVIDNFNGEPRMKFWSTNECNRVDGTDGSQFPPHLMDKKQPLQVFIKAFCRRFPMVYDSEVSLFNSRVPTWRYKAPSSVFDSPAKNPENECYCDVGSGKCPPSGVFNATLCFDAPIYSSFPHFLYGDKELFENIDGLEPNESKHLTYADLHPRLAFPMAGSSRFQINVQVHKTVTDLDYFQDEQILPVMWMEVTSEEVPEELRAVIYHSTFSANAIQLILRYGSIFGLAVSLTLLVASCYIKNADSDQLNQTKCIKDFKQAGKATMEELVTIDLNDPTQAYTESNYLAKESNI